MMPPQLPQSTPTSWCLPRHLRVSTCSVQNYQCYSGRQCKEMRYRDDHGGIKRRIQESKLLNGEITSIATTLNHCTIRVKHVD